MRSRRHQRFIDIIGRRLAHVRCAVEAVHHRHNVSAILRTADAMGLHTVHLVGVERFKAVKGAARGAERWLDIRLEESAATTIEALRREGYAIWACDIADDARTPQTVPIDRPICLWFGGEHLGVSEEVRQAADGILTIPMQGFAQSLNVSVATAMAVNAVTTRVRTELGDAALLDPDVRDEVLQSWFDRDAALGIGLEQLDPGSASETSA